MPTNHTTNYQLSQWSRTDQVKMEDFNADNAKIDAALGQKAEQSAVAALAQTVEGHTSALAGKGNCRVETVTYTGASQDGEGLSKRITFSAKPAFVVIIGGDATIMALAVNANKSYFVGQHSASAGNIAHGCPGYYSSGNTIVLTDFFCQCRMDVKGIEYQATAWIPVG